MDSNKKNRWNLISRWMQGLALSGVLLTVVLPSGNAQELTTMAARTESVSVITSYSIHYTKLYESTKGPLETTTLIGGVCKRSDALS